MLERKVDLYIDSSIVDLESAIVVGLGGVEGDLGETGAVREDTAEVR